MQAAPKGPPPQSAGGWGLNSAAGARQAWALAEGGDADAARLYLDRADRALADLDAVIEIERHAEREQQHGADYIAMADQHDAFVQVALVEFEQRRDDPLLHRPHTFAAGDRRQAALRAPGLPARVGADRVEGGAGPFAEIELQ